MTKAYEYCKANVKAKTTPKYVKMQMREFMRIEEGKDPKYTLNMKVYKQIEGVLKLLIMPKGLKAGQTLYECTTGYQWLVYTAVLCTVYRDNDKKRRYETCILEIPRKNFKALSLDTPIPTPDGWKTMEDIHTGDYVFSRSGKPTLVIGESEIFNKPMYEVEFEDGEVIKASSDHIWTVCTKSSRKTCESGRKHIGIAKTYRAGGWYDITTEEMAGDYERPRKDGKGMEYKYRVPMPDHVEYQVKTNLPISPYLLGVWLGDGTSTGTNITLNNDDKEEIIKYIEEASGYKTELHENKDRACYIKVDKQKSSKTSPESFIYNLRKLDLLGNKHIPQMYLTAPIEDRWELLKGLMDTDGTCSKSGQCSFTQKSEAVAMATLELINSLGIKARLIKRKAYLNNRDMGDVYYISFWTTKEKSCFKLKRKTERLKDKLADRMKAKSITRITPIGATPSKCLKVADSEHLFLAGKHFTATHNTFTVATLFIILFITEPRYSDFYSVAPDGKLSREIKEALDKTIKSSPLIYEHNGAKRFKLLRDYDLFLLKESKYTPLNYSNSNMDGKLPSVYCADEVGALPNTYAIEAMQSGQLNILNKLGFIISTKYPTIDNPIEIYDDYAKKILDGVVKDESVFSLLYVPDGINWETDDLVLRQANPVSLEIPEIWDDLLKKRAKAIAMESARENFVTKHCNIVYQGAGTETYIDVKDVQKCKVNSIDWSGRVVYLGVDLSESNDNTSVAMVAVDENENILAEVVAFIPEGRIEEKNAFEKLDYREYMRTEKAIACGDKVIDYAVVEDYILNIEKKYGVQVQAIGYDRYNALSTAQKCERAGYNTIEIRQHSSVLASPTKRLKEKILSGEFQYTDNKLLEINFQNTRCTYDTNRNAYCNKKKSKGKIDMVISLINAVYLLEQDYFLNNFGDFTIQII